MIYNFTVDALEVFPREESTMVLDNTFNRNDAISFIHNKYNINKKLISQGLYKRGYYRAAYTIIADFNHSSFNEGTHIHFKLMANLKRVYDIKQILII